MPPDLLPDLVAEPPTSPQPLDVERLGDGATTCCCASTARSTTSGRGPLEIRGSQPANGAMTVTGQRIYRTDSSFRDDNSRHPPIHFENSDGHRHWHLKGAARYSLWDEAGSAQVAPGIQGRLLPAGQRAGRQLRPGDPVYTRSATQYCREGQPNAAQVFEGISAGWLDYYPSDLPFQWVDVSDVAPGRYRLGADVDPDNFVLESNEANNGPALASSIVTVPGYVASPVTQPGAGPRRSRSPRQPYGSPGPPVFVIESAPAHGTLSVAGGSPCHPPGRLHAAPGLRRERHLHLLGTRLVERVPAAAPRGGRNGDGATPASSSSRPSLLTGLRFRRHGRFLRVRARAARSGAADPHREGQTSPGLVPQARARGAALHLPHRCPGMRR